MRSEWLRPFGFFAAVGATALLLYVALPRLLGKAAGPDAAIVSLVKGVEKNGLQVLPAPGIPPIVASKTHFDRITVTADPEAHTAVAVTTLDFDGYFGETKVSSLGYEKIQFRWEDGEWHVEGGMAPRLTGIVLALEARRHALQTGNVEQLLALEGVSADAGLAPEVADVLRLSNRKVTARAWYIRSERDSVLVTEEARVEGALPDRPVDDVTTKRLQLERKPGGEFFFPHGLM